MSKSKIYRLLTDGELKKVVKRHFNTESFKYEVKTGGMFNTTYLIELDGKERYILRVGPVNRELLIPFENGLMRAETRFNSLCRLHGIPVSDEVVCSTDKTLFDRDYMIVKYINSEPLCEMTLDERTADELYCRVGEYAAGINGITGDKFGRLATISESGCDEWGEYLNYEMAQAIDKHREIDIFSESELLRIAQTYERHTALFNEIKTPSLVHADIWSGNVLIGENEGRCDVAAIIDGDRALFGDYEFELASGWMINDAFIRGYGKPLKTDKKSVLRRELYKLLYNVFDSYVLLGEYDDREKAKLCKNGVFECLAEIEKMNGVYRN